MDSASRYRLAWIRCKGREQMMGDKAIALLSLILAIVIWWWVTLYQLP
jgi:hypothetical protein